MVTYRLAQCTVCIAPGLFFEFGAQTPWKNNSNVTVCSKLVRLKGEEWIMRSFAHFHPNLGKVSTIDV